MRMLLLQLEQAACAAQACAPLAMHPPCKATNAAMQPPHQADDLWSMEDTHAMLQRIAKLHAPRGAKALALLKQQQELQQQLDEQLEAAAGTLGALQPDAAAPDGRPPPVKLPHQTVLVGATLRDATVEAFRGWCMHRMEFLRVAEAEPMLPTDPEEQQQQRQQLMAASAVLPKHLLHTFVKIRTRHDEEPVGRRQQLAGDAPDGDSSFEFEKAATLPTRDRVSVLQQLLARQRGSGRRVLVFVRSTRDVEGVQRRLESSMRGEGGKQAGGNKQWEVRFVLLGPVCCVVLGWGLLKEGRRLTAWPTNLTAQPLYTSQPHNPTNPPPRCTPSTATSPARPARPHSPPSASPAPPARPSS